MSDFRPVPGSPESAQEFFHRLLGPSLGRLHNAVPHDCRRDGGTALVTGAVWESLEDGLASARIHLIDVGSGSAQPLTKGGEGQEMQPRFSPDGSRVAYLCHAVGRPAQVRVVGADGGDPRSFPIEGHVAEGVEWFEDGRRLLVVAAEEGASAGVLSGSGKVPSAAEDGERPSWAPSVERGGSELGGWRRAFALDLESGLARQLSPAGINVWEACCAGDAVLAVVSDGPTEGSWAHSWLALVGQEGAGAREVYRPRHQICGAAASADGTFLAVIEGIASDRGLVAGDVILGGDGRSPRRLETGGVDATWIGFRDGRSLCLAGVRGTLTVLEEVSLEDGRIEVHLDSGLTTTGEFYPSAAVLPGGGMLLTGGRWNDPPRVAIARGGQLTEVLSLRHPGAEWLEGLLGPIEEISWTSRDGLEVGGLFARPRRGQPPYATVVGVHGGPAWAWRPSWPGFELANYAFLSACGLGWFLPNPRGSSGRGQDFLALELGDYGGGEVDDLLTGLDHLVQAGLADGERLGVYGASHGGYMGCWLSTRTDRFRAMVAISPVTDWYSQHYGSNIPDFDEMYLGGSPRDPGGPYHERSPVFFAQRSKTPALITAGLRDRCTPPGQAEEFHRALLAAGVESELVLYPEEGHGVRHLPARIDLAARASGHLARHLLAGGDA